MFRIFFALLYGAACLFGASAPPSHVYVSLKYAPSAISWVDAYSGIASHTFGSVVGAVNLGVSPDGSKAYVLAPSNADECKPCGNDTVSVYALPSGKKLQTIALSGSPWGIYFDAAGDRAYVVGSDYLAQTNQDSLHVFAIDTASGTVIGDVRFSQNYGYSSVSESAISPDGKFLYVNTALLGGSPQILVLALPSLSLVHTVTVPTGIAGLAFTPDGSQLVVATSGGFLIYRTASLGVPVQVPSTSYLGPMAISPNGRFAYTPSRDPRTENTNVAVLDLVADTLTLGAPISTANVDNFLISPDGAHAFAGSELINLRSQTISVPAVSTLSYSTYGQFSADSSGVWVVNQGSSALVVVDPSTKSVVGSIATPPGPRWLAAGPGNTLDIAAAKLAVIDTKINRIVSIVEPDPKLGDLGSIAAAGSHLYVASSKDVASYSFQTGQFTQLPLPEDGVDVTFVNYMAANPKAGQLYVDYYQLLIGPPDAMPRDSAPGGLLAFSADSNALLYSLSIHPGGPIAVSPDGTMIYVNTITGNKEVSTITVVDAASGTVLGAYEFSGIEYRAMAVSPDGKTLYALDARDRDVTEIDLGTMTAQRSFPAPPSSSSMALTADGSTLYLSDQGSTEVMLIDTATGDESKLEVGSPSYFVIAAQ